MSEYSEKLRSPKWQKKRLQILERDKWKCLSCGDEENNLQIHHLIYSKGEPWEAPDETLETLCETCHNMREEFNDLFGGRSLLSTRVVSAVFRIFYPAFDGTADVSKIENVGDFLRACINKTLDEDKKVHICIIPKTSKVNVVHASVAKEPEPVP